MKELQGRMLAAAADLDFEEAARLRDEYKRLEAKDLGLNSPAMGALVSQQAKSERRKGGPLPRSQRGGFTGAQPQPDSAYKPQQNKSKFRKRR